jgi:hypothetical protein
VTLRDARKLGLVPSVTGILALEAKPQLENWKINQALMAALTLPRNPGESDDDFIVRAKGDSQDQVRQAAERGTQIHGAIQGSFEGRPTAAEDLPYVSPVRDWLAQRYGLDGFEAEQSFASPYGFGGKCDLVNRGRSVVVDFKGKDIKPGQHGKDLAYPEHVTQLAAYAVGLGLDINKVDCCNIFFCRKTPGLICVREWDQEEISQGWEAFKCLHRLYVLRKNFDPAFEVAA